MDTTVSRLPGRAWSTLHRWMYAPIMRYLRVNALEDGLLGLRPPMDALADI